MTHAEIEETIRKGYDMINKGLKHAEKLPNIPCSVAVQIDDCQVAKHELHKCLCMLLELNGNDGGIQPRFGGK